MKETLANVISSSAADAKVYSRWCQGLRMAGNQEACTGHVTANRFLLNFQDPPLMHWGYTGESNHWCFDDILAVWKKMDR